MCPIVSGTGSPSYPGLKGRTTVVVVVVWNQFTLADHRDHGLKPGFHYPSWRPELMGDRFPLPYNTGRVDGRAFPLAELTSRVNVPSWRVTGFHYPSSRAVNLGSENQALLGNLLINCYCCEDECWKRCGLSSLPESACVWWWWFRAACQTAAATLAVSSL